MFVIIKHIESGIDLEDIEKLAFLVPKGWFNRKTGIIKAIKLIGLETSSGNLVERHSLIRLQPDSYKKQLIKTLNSQNLNGVKVLAADYAIRHWSNDPRQDQKISFLSSGQKNRRKNDRRRAGLSMVKIAEKTYVHAGD